MKRENHPIFIRPLKRATLASWCLVLMISLTWQHSHSAVPQTQDQIDLSGKNILIVHSLEGNAPVFVGTDEGFSSTLQSGGVMRLNQYFESLDLRRNPSPEHRKLLVEQMRVRYSRRRLDMIVTMYPEALDFVLKDCRDIFHDVPILALYLPEGIELPKTDRRVIGHSASPDVVGTIEIALKLVPEMKHVYVVSGTHPVDRATENRARRDLRRWESRLEFHYVSNMPLEEMLAAVSSMPRGSVVIILAFSQDVAGKSQTTPEVARRLSQVSSGPIFGILDAMLGQGITGGSLISFDLIGNKAGQLALDILGGAKTPENIPNALDVPPVPMFDWRELRRWNLSEAALPKGSIVINRETTFGDYKYYIIGGMVVLLAQTLLVIGLLVQRHRKAVAEEALRQKTEELDQFFDVTLDLLGIANTDGYFLRLNPAVERLLGYTREELMARPFFDFVHPDDLDSTREAVSTLAAQQKIFLFENRYRCKDGTYRWLEWSSAPAGRLIYAAARDITEKKRGEAALEERLRFEELLSNISSKFVNIPPDRVDPEIEQALKQFLDFFKVDRCGLIRVLPGTGTWQITHAAFSKDAPPVPVGGDLPTSTHPWVYHKLVEKGEVVSVSRPADLPAEANVDKQTWIGWGIQSTLSIPISIEESVVHAITINAVKSEKIWPEELFPRLRLLGEIFVNALQRKQAEVGVNRARQQLLHIERSARLGELTASLAHELNQPLAAILSNAQAGLRFLQSGKIDLDEFREILQDIIHDDQRAGNVIRSLRSMMKREEVERSPVILNDVLNDVVQIFRTESVFRNVCVETELDRSLPPILGDKVQLQQVMLNLIVNAADAMSQNPPEQRKIILRTQVKDGRIRATIRDFGPGIDKENLDRIFHPFFTTKGTGLGIGLAVSQTIIEAHEGRIWAENNPDRGASFFFEIPISQKSGK